MTRIESVERRQPEAARQMREERGVLRRHPIVFAAGFLALIVFGLAGYLYWDHLSHFESTDDAFIDARQYAISPKVGGYVVAVEVTDNQHVEPGAVLVRIDPRDYQIALENAQAQLAAAQASVKNLEAQVAAQQAQTGASRAQVAQSRAAQRFAQQEAARSQDLAARGAGTLQRQQQATSTLRQEQAREQSAEDAVTAAQAQARSLEAQRSSAEANVREAAARVEQAKLNLSYTTVVAAEAGRVVRLTAAVGQLAQAGAALAMFVPDRIWVTANFKETQLDDIRPGQPVEIRIDAYPEHRVKGRVVSIQPGSGVAFSVLPAENATGNYVKIVQRVPVKISIESPPRDVSLGPGMSVTPTIRTRPGPSLFERLTGA